LKRSGLSTVAQQVRAGLDGQLAPDLALGSDLADRLEPRPGMALLQPGDIIAHAGPALLDPAMAAVSIGSDGERRGGIVEEGAHVAMQRALVAFERQNVIAALANDLSSDGGLAVERIGGDDRTLERE
jgi:hypothetical protein